MRLDLTEEEVRALLREPDNLIENDRYPLSPRIRLRAGEVSRCATGAAARESADT